MPDYDAMRVEYPKLKAALTRAEKKGPLAVLEEVNRAFTRFDIIGWPDGWHRWNIAWVDAQFTIQHGVTAPLETEGDPSEYDRYSLALRDHYENGWESV